MPDLEHRDDWPAIVALKDALSLAELGRRVGVPPGAVSAALERSGALRGAAPASRPTPDEATEVRTGSKDARIAPHRGLLGVVPDADVAVLAAVSVRTIASYRSRHGIPGYRGPRRPASSGARRSRIDPFAHLLGQVADRVVAERAGVSLNAVRNYRTKRGIPASVRAAEPAPAPAVEGAAWRVVWVVAGAEGEGVVLAATLDDALAVARRCAPGEVIGVVRVGDVVVT